MTIPTLLQSSSILPLPSESPPYTDPSQTATSISIPASPSTTTTITTTDDGLFSDLNEPNNITSAILGCFLGALLAVALFLLTIACCSWNRQQRSRVQGVSMLEQREASMVVDEEQARSRSRRRRRLARDMNRDENGSESRSRGRSGQMRGTRNESLGGERGRVSESEGIPMVQVLNEARDDQDEVNVRPGRPVIAARLISFNI